MGCSAEVKQTDAETTVNTNVRKQKEIKLQQKNNKIFDNFIKEKQNIIKQEEKEKEKEKENLRIQKTRQRTVPPKFNSKLFLQFGINQGHQINSNIKLYNKEGNLKNINNNCMKLLKNNNEKHLTILEPESTVTNDKSKISSTLQTAPNQMNNIIEENDETSDKEEHVINNAFTYRQCNFNNNLKDFKLKNEDYYSDSAESENLNRMDDSGDMADIDIDNKMDKRRKKFNYNRWTFRPKTYITNVKKNKVDDD